MYTPSRQSISITIKIWIKINKRVILGTVIDENLGSRESPVYRTKSRNFR